MTTTLVQRPARIAVPDPGSEPIVVAAPPQNTSGAQASASLPLLLTPVLGGAGSLITALTAQGRPLQAIIGLLVLVGSVGAGAILFVGTRNGARRQVRENRERYFDYLENLRRLLRKVVADQNEAAAIRHPEPGALLDICRMDARRWERRANHGDALELRIGTGRRPLARPLSMQADTNNPLVSYDEVGLGVAQQLVDRYGSLSNQPITAPLRAIGTLSVVGDRTVGRRLARAMLAQLVTFHSPDDVRVAVVRSQQLANLWDWVKWLPHSLDENRADGPLPSRLVAGSTVELAELLAEELEERKVNRQRRRGLEFAGRRLVIVVDSEFQPSISGLDSDEGESLAELGIHLVVLVDSRAAEPSVVDARVTVNPDGTASAPGIEDPFTVDSVSVAEVAGIARQLAPVRLSAAESGDVLTSTISLPEVLGVADPANIDVSTTWKPRPQREFLRVPVGVGPDGRPVLLDVKESAQGGMGPHGLVVGATGSGKSEMLRTMVASLVINHSPDRLALLLVDFKGGATFADMDPLPHVAGSITNLADDLTLVDRFKEALYGEMTRRQQILSDTGKLPNVDAYEQVRQTRGGLPALPHLLVIIDEFSELLTAKPDFAELFVAVGRIGRSIGVHLLLATQRLEAGKIKGLESHLSYRIGLRTFSEAESREVIGVPDAYHLPPEPGSGFLKVDTTVFERFKAALVSSTYRPPAEDDVTVAPVLPYNASNGAGALAAAAEQLSSVKDESDEEGTTVLRVIVEKLSMAEAQAVRPVWLPPLPPVLTLDGIHAREAAGEAADPRHIIALLGLRDIPGEQRQDPLSWDATGTDGNLVVVGAPLSGKSTLIRTLISSLALRYAPGQVAFFCVDYGGGQLVPLEALPHVAAVATRVDGDRVRRTIGDVQSMLDAREAVLRQHGLDSPDALRRARAAGTVPASVFGDVFLVIDGWGPLREADNDIEDVLVEIAQRGPALGVHTVVTVSSPNQVRSRMASSMTGRIELRLTDHFDSQVDRLAAQEMPSDVPGRVLVRPKHFAQIALPRVDGIAETQDLGDGVKHLIRQVERKWPAGQVPVVQVLPDLADLSSLLDGVAARKERRIALGLSERDLSPAYLNMFGGDPHLLVYGDSQTGKSTLLRSLVRQVIAGSCSGSVADGTATVGIVMVDYRRANLDLVPKDYLLAYSTAADHTAAVAQEIAKSLKERLPGPDVTPQQLRERSWWDGMEVVIVVDDYDLVSGSSGSPLSPLIPYLAQGHDLGMHLVLARRTGGASRSIFEGVVQQLNDLSTPGLLFSGDRLEGRLVNGAVSRQLPVGRALLARRGTAPEQVQTFWTPPVE
ncbi:type VII secretion protein EccCa [Fodinicola acaciae]|uniref:type VII secretion protein EccCa n=1 Tax=Fodinicola acaciae TaxID=2681555 RepID=UPI0013D08B62|nr:type VII secretion protein EccCa [Fodinicola acaciae]